MSSCEDAAVMITALVDGELDVDDMEMVRAHLDMCSDCTARKEMEARLKVFLAERLGRVDTPDDLKGRIRGAIEKIDLADGGADDPAVSSAGAPPAAPKPKSRAWMWPLVLIVSVMVVMGVVLMVVETGNISNSGNSGELPVELANLHYAATGAGVYQISSHDPDELFAWFSARLEAFAGVPDLAALDVEPTGGRVLNLMKHPMSLLLYRNHAGAPPAITVVQAAADFVLPTGPDGPVKSSGQDVYLTRQYGLEVAWFATDDAVWMLVSKREREDMLALLPVVIAAVDKK